MHARAGSFDRMTRHTVSGRFVLACRAAMAEEPKIFCCRGEVTYGYMVASYHLLRRLRGVGNRVMLVV